VVQSAWRSTRQNKLPVNWRRRTAPSSTSDTHSPSGDLPSLASTLSSTISLLSSLPLTPVYRCYANYFTPAIDREVSPFYAIAHSGGNYVFTLFRCLSRCPDVCPVTTWTRPHGCLVGRVHYTHAPVEASGDCGRSCFFITTFAAMLRCLTVLVTVAKLGETVALAAIVKQLS